MTTGDDPSETTTAIAAIPSLQSTIAITDREAAQSVTRMTAAIETETAVVRQVLENVSRARHQNRNLLRMSVTGEPFSSSSWLRVYAPKS